MRTKCLIFVTVYYFWAGAEIASSTTPSTTQEHFYSFFGKHLGNISDYYTCDLNSLNFIASQAAVWAAQGHNADDIFEMKAFAYSVAMVKYSNCFEKFYGYVRQHLVARIQGIKLRTCNIDCINQLEQDLQLQFRTTYYVGNTFRIYVRENKSDYGDLLGEPLAMATAPTYAQSSYIPSQYRW